MLILDILRPFVNGNPPLYTFLAPDSTVEKAYRASLSQLKHIVRVERFCSQSQRSICCWHTLYLYVANAMLSDSPNPERRYYFLLCIRGYRELYRAFPAGRSIVQGLLVMAMRRNLFSSKECSIMLRQLQAPQGTHDSSEGAQITFMIDLDLALESPMTARVSDLADQFSELFLFETLTDGGDFDVPGALGET